MKEICTIHELVRYSAELFGSRPYVKYRKKRETYVRSFLDVKRDTDAVIEMLARKNIVNTHFILVGNKSYEWVISYFGVASSGNVIVPIDKKETPENALKLSLRSDAKGIIYDSSCKKNVNYLIENNPNIEFIISMDEIEVASNCISLKKEIADYNGTCEPKCDPDKLCTIIFTSGTSGESKGVMLTNRNITANAMNSVYGPVEQNGINHLSVLPLQHAYCFMADFMCGLRRGNTVCITSSAGGIMADCQVYHPVTMTLVPAILSYLYKVIVKKSEEQPEQSMSMIAKELLGGEIRAITLGGASSDRKLVQNFWDLGIPVFIGYGMSENSPIVSSSSYKYHKLGSCGKVLENTQVRTVDGELQIKGDSLMMGYYKNAEANNQVFTEDGWFKTGDLGYVDEDGYLYITGRKSNLIILGNGENVLPEEVEGILSQEDLIQEVIVFGEEEEIHAEIYPNYNYIKENKIEDMEEAIKNAVFRSNQKLPVYKKVAKFTLRETEFPKTASKKIIRKKRNGV